MATGRNVEVYQDRLKLAFTGRVDANKNDYYYTKTHCPVALDLSNAVIHLFPWENKNGEFGIEMIFRKYDPDYKDQQQGNATRRRRVRPSKADNNYRQDDTDDEGEE